MGLIPPLEHGRTAAAAQQCNFCAHRRLALRKALKKELGCEDDAAREAREAAAAAATAAAADAVDPEEKLLAEMTALREKLQKDEERARKKRRDVKRKAKIRAVRHQCAELGARGGVGA
jgi:AdoMet-dependent rRNA methyltransferase SPB1